MEPAENVRKTGCNEGASGAANSVAGAAADAVASLPFDIVRPLCIEVRGAEGSLIEGSVRGHVLHTDNPTEFGGSNTTANPAETFAFGLGACVVNTGRLIAGQWGLAPTNISAVIEGSVNLSRVLGIPSDDRAGFQGLKIRVSIEGGLSEADKERLLAEIRSRCPMCDNVENPTPFEIAMSPSA